MVKGQNKCARHSRPYSIIIKYCDIKGKNELMIRISGQEKEMKQGEERPFKISRGEAKAGLIPYTRFPSPPPKPPTTSKGLGRNFLINK